MRPLTLFAFATTAATAAAQQPDRPRCRDCPTAVGARAAAEVEARAATAVRAAQARDSVWARGSGFDGELERLAAQLMRATELQTQAVRSLRAISTGSVEGVNREQVEAMAARFRAQLDQARRDGQLLRSQLVALCDRSAKPQGYMGITFSATMRANAAASGGEVFQFAENPTVETVEPGSPAERAGVAKGDEILSIGGQSVVGRDIVFTRLLRPGNKLPIRVRHDGEIRDVVLLIGRRPPSLDNGCPFLDARVTAAFGEQATAAPLSSTGRGIIRVTPLPPGGVAATAPAAPRGASPADAPTPPARETYAGTVTIAPMPLVPSVPLATPAPREGRTHGGTVYVYTPGSANAMVIAGATVVRMNAELREPFGVKNGGVLVVDVARGSPAYASGLKGGDIIVSAGRLSVSTPVSIRRAIDDADGNELTMRIVRKKKPQSIVLRW